MRFALTHGVRYAYCQDMSSAPDIPAIRKTLGLTQADLAKQAGVDVSTVWRWENEGVPERGLARAFLDRLASDAAKAKARAA
jgi:DNA-binding transcriptional regulator YiaG